MSCTMQHTPPSTVQTSQNKALVGGFVGVLQLNTAFPRLIGDIGCPESFDFPVKYHQLSRAHVNNIVCAGSPDQAVVQESISAAQSLVDQGAVIITTSCGFLLSLQLQLAAAVSVPVITSALLALEQYSPTERDRIGILTANAKALDDVLSSQLSMDRASLHLAGLEHAPVFQTWLQSHDQDFFRSDKSHQQAIEQELLDAAMGLLAQQPQIDTWLFECTNLRAFQRLLVQQTARPAIGIDTLLHAAWQEYCSQTQPSR